MRKSKIIKVFFNASVILAGLKSPSGGSGKILQWGRKRKIKALSSEVILDEVLRNVARVGLPQDQVLGSIKEIFLVAPAPSTVLVKSFHKISIDAGDNHVLASSQENKADFLVTLDKKHLLILKNKVEKFKIVSPGELIGMYHDQFKKVGEEK